MQVIEKEGDKSSPKNGAVWCPVFLMIPEWGLPLKGQIFRAMYQVVNPERIQDSVRLSLFIPKVSTEVMKRQYSHKSKEPYYLDLIRAYNGNGARNGIEAQVFVLGTNPGGYLAINERKSVIRRTFNHYIEREEWYPENCSSGLRLNIVHASESEEEARRDLQAWSQVFEKENYATWHKIKEELKITT